MRDITKPTDLCVPIYLNQKIVFDVLAMLEDGFSQLSVLKTSASEAEDRKSGVGGSVGASNVFALLGVSLKGEIGKEGKTQEQKEIATEKVHTPASLFSKLRLLLDDKSLVEKVRTLEEVERLAGGQFIEFRAVLRKNPLFDAIETFKQLMSLATLFSEQQTGASQGGKHSGRSKGRKSTGTHQPKDENQVILEQLDGLRTALTQSGSLEIVGEMLDTPPAKAVLSTNLEYFNDQDASEIIDGEFLVIGKVVRVVGSDSEESINLLRKTDFGRLNSAMFDELGSAFADVEEAGVDLPEFVTEVKGPAIQIIPVAIFA